jgi:hypothetical protein
MTRKSVRGPGPNSPPHGSGRVNREEFKGIQSHECAKAIADLDPDTRARILSDLQEFMRRFRTSSANDELLNSRFTYKSLKGKDCREVKLNEIYVVSKQYRVTVTVLVHDETVWFVYCFKKGKSDQAQGIARSVRIAQGIRKDTP